jgi:lysophospholipid acyltransferase (LPLAT)-like uncharacterized protein
MGHKARRPIVKLRKPWMIKTTALALTSVLRCVINTLSVRIRYFGPTNPDPNQTRGGERFIYSFWHEYISFLPFFFTQRKIHALVGDHADAEIYAEVLRFLGMPSIRGSSTRGGVKAVLQILKRAGSDIHLAVATDGPRGPRRQIQPGLPYLASRTGIPVAPIGIGFDRPWRLRSWDKFAVPRPWSQAKVIFARPIFVPRQAGKDELEMYRRRMEVAQLEASALAESWAETGCWPVSGAARKVA